MQHDNTRDFKATCNVKYPPDDAIKWKHFPPYWPLWGHPPVTEPLTQGPVTRSFDAFFDLRLNKRLGKQSSRQWFETLSNSLWRHCNAIMFLFIHHFKTNHIHSSGFNIGKSERLIWTNTNRLIHFTCNQRMDRLSNFLQERNTNSDLYDIITWLCFYQTGSA